MKNMETRLNFGEKLYIPKTADAHPVAFVRLLLKYLSKFLPYY